MAQEKIVQTAGRDQLGDFALNLRNSTTMSSSEKYGTAPTNLICVIAAWSRLPRLSVRESQIIRSYTISSRQRKTEFRAPRLPKSLLISVFYAGWPKALGGVYPRQKGVWAEDTAGEDAKAAFQREMIFPIGEPNTAYAQYFIGNSYLAFISTEQVPA